MGKVSQATFKEANRCNLAYEPDTYLIFKWVEKKKKVYFSGTRRGDAMEIHIASINGRMRLEKAVNEFCEAVFKRYDWCQRITGLVLPEKIVQLALRTGFKVIDYFDATYKGNKVTFTFIQRSRI